MIICDNYHNGPFMWSPHGVIPRSASPHRPHHNLTKHSPLPKLPQCGMSRNKYINHPSHQHLPLKPPTHPSSSLNLSTKLPTSFRHPLDPMARHKQATPLRREHSSEYTSSADRNGATPTKRSRNLDNTSPAPLSKANGQANGAVVAPVAAQKKKQAGLLELVIGVSGIYASL